MVLRVAQSVLDTLERARPQRGLGWLIGFVTPAATHVLSVAKANDISVDAVHDLVSVDTLQIEQSLGEIQDIVLCLNQCLPDYPSTPDDQSRCSPTNILLAVHTAMD